MEITNREIKDIEKRKFPKIISFKPIGIIQIIRKIELFMKYNAEEIREKYKDLFEFSLDIIYVNDLRGNFLDANDIALETLGYKRNEIPDISFIDLLDEENLMKALKVTNEIRKTGKQSKRSEYKLV